MIKPCFVKVKIRAIDARRFVRAVKKCPHLASGVLPCCGRFMVGSQVTEV